MCSAVTLHRSPAQESQESQGPQGNTSAWRGRQKWGSASFFTEVQDADWEKVTSVAELHWLSQVLVYILVAGAR